MERYKAIRIHTCILILSFGLIALIAGCAAQPIFRLEDDRFSEPRFRSLIFGQLDIKGLAPGYARFCFRAENNEKSWSLPNIYRGNHTEIPFFFVFEAEPGEYLFDQIDVSSGLHWYFHELDTTFSIPSGSLVYLGLIELKLVKYKPGDQGVLLDFVGSFLAEALERRGCSNYEITIKNDIKNEFEKSLKALREKYPLLYEKYKDKVVTASYSKMKAAGRNRCH